LYRTGVPQAAPALTDADRDRLVDLVTEVVMEYLAATRPQEPPPGGGPSMATLEAMGVVTCDGGQCRACGRCAH
jgi:hypothetical protein